MLLCALALVLLIVCPFGDATFQELPTLVTLVAGSLPQISIGTDSRVAFGYRFGEHADFQTVIDIGPQTHITHIDNNALDRSDTTRRRDINQGIDQHHTSKPLNTSRKITSTTKSKTTTIITTTASPPTTASDSSASRYLRQWANSWNTIIEQNTIRTTTKKPKSTPKSTKLPSRTTKPAQSTGFKLFRQIFRNFGWNF